MRPSRLGVKNFFSSQKFKAIKSPFAARRKASSQKTCLRTHSAKITRKKTQSPNVIFLCFILYSNIKKRLLLAYLEAFHCLYCGFAVPDLRPAVAGRLPGIDGGVLVQCIGDITIRRSRQRSGKAIAAGGVSAHRLFRRSKHRIPLDRAESSLIPETAATITRNLRVVNVNSVFFHQNRSAPSWHVAFRTISAPIGLFRLASARGTLIRQNQMCAKLRTLSPELAILTHDLLSLSVNMPFR